MKYLLLLIALSANASDNEAYMVAGICKVMIKQTVASTITPQLLEYWQNQAKDANMSFKEYYDLCKGLSDAYDREDKKEGEKANQGKL